MCLTEAIHIVTLMSWANCQATSFALETDEMLRSVCRWRLTSGAQFNELARLVGSGEPWQSVRTSSVAYCVESALREQTWVTTDLMQHCGVTGKHLSKIVSRLRDAGCPIVRNDHGGAATLSIGSHAEQAWARKGRDPAPIGRKARRPYLLSPSPPSRPSPSHRLAHQKDQHERHH